MHGLYQGLFFYFHIVVRHHSTRVSVILFTAIEKVRLTLIQLSGLSLMLNSIMCTSLMHSSSPVSDTKRGKNG